MFNMEMTIGDTRPARLMVVLIASYMNMIRESCDSHVTVM